MPASDTSQPAFAPRSTISMTSHSGSSSRHALPRASSVTLTRLVALTLSLTAFALSIVASGAIATSSVAPLVSHSISQ